MIKIGTKRLINICVIISLLFMSIGYSAINEELTISGEAVVRVDEDIRITNIKMIESTNEGYETYNAKYSKDTTTMFVTLPNPNSTVTYEVEVKNTTGKPIYIDDIHEKNNNSNITYELKEMSIGDIIVDNKFYLIVKNSSNSYQQTNMLLEFALKKLEDTQWTYNYTANQQEFSTPLNGYYKIEAWGAQGGTISESVQGGKGAYTSGVIKLNKDEKLYIHVGGQGSKTRSGILEYVPGGYNGGGSTGGQACCNRLYGSGGGSTDIRLTSGTWDNQESLASRIMVASGGGGAFLQEGSEGNTGGYGGGLRGGDGSQTSYGGNTYCHGLGATQTRGGKITTDCTVQSDLDITGEFGKGGIAGLAEARTGGGSGYYGGSKSGHIASAGGGSSYISGYLGSIAVINKDNINARKDEYGHQCYDEITQVIINSFTCSYHYSKKIFYNTDMINGDELMPTHNGMGTMIGNSGNGYAKITYCGQNKNDCNANNIKYIIEYDKLNEEFEELHVNDDSAFALVGASYVIVASYTGGITTITTKNKIDLSEYNKIVFKVRMFTNLESVINITNFGITDTKESTATNNFYKYVQSDPINIRNPVSATYELDISDIKDSKYIKVSVNHTNYQGAHTADTIIDKIYLSK